MLGGERLGFQAVEGGADRYVRDRPHVWYQPHAKASAFVVREVIGHPRTRVVPIDWSTEWDIVVSWADRPESDGAGGRLGPRDAGPDFPPADLRRAQELLDSVAAYLAEARPAGY